jgi:hypothetical protein
MGGVMTTRTHGDESTKSTGTGAGMDEGSKLKETAMGVADEAAQTVEARAARGMSQAGEVLHQVANAVRDSSTGLQTEQPQIARVMATAAEKLDEAATYVSDREPRELIDTAQDTARRQPALVIGGGLLAGILLGRVLRSAGTRATANATNRTGYDAGYSGREYSTRGQPTSDRIGPASGYGTGYGASYDRTSAMSGYDRQGSTAGSDPSAAGTGSRQMNGSDRRSTATSSETGEG